MKPHAWKEMKYLLRFLPNHLSVNKDWCSFSLQIQIYKYLNKACLVPHRSFRETQRNTALAWPPSSTCVRSYCMIVTRVPQTPSVIPSSRLHETWTGDGGISVLCPWKEGSSKLKCSNSWERRRTKKKIKIQSIHGSQFPFVRNVKKQPQFPKLVVIYIQLGK